MWQHCRRLGGLESTSIGLEIVLYYQQAETFLTQDRQGREVKELP